MVMNTAHSEKLSTKERTLQFAFLRSLGHANPVVIPTILMLDQIHNTTSGIVETAVPSLAVSSPNVLTPSDAVME
jgi:hypothetical protein